MRPAGEGIAKSNPADPVDMAQVEDMEQVQAMTEHKKEKNRRKADHADSSDARMDSGEVMIQVDGRFCQQDASGTWRDISTGEECRAVGAA